MSVNTVIKEMMMIMMMIIIIIIIVGLQKMTLISTAHRIRKSLG